MAHKVLVVLPESIGGRLTTSSIKDGFLKNDFEVDIFDELKENKRFNFENYDYIVGYDFSPIKFKFENNLKNPVITYFSDVIQEKTSGKGYLEYFKYLRNKDIFVFYWDKILSEKENWNYCPHFVNTEIYKDYKLPKYDVSFMGRLDTSLRLKTYLELNKKLKGLKFTWHAIKRHFDDAINRCNTEEERNILKNTYKGFIDNEKDMAEAINDTKIVYNINAQGISSLNYRTFQVLACKRLLISDNRLELSLFDNILPVYHDIDDLSEKIKFYLENEEDYTKITKKSREIIELNHDSKICVKNILKIVRNS